MPIPAKLNPVIIKGSLDENPKSLDLSMVGAYRIRLVAYSYPLKASNTLTHPI